MASHPFTFAVQCFSWVVTCGGGGGCIISESNFILKSRMFKRNLVKIYDILKAVLKPPRGGGTHDLRMDGGLPRGFQEKLPSSNYGQLPSYLL